MSTKHSRTGAMTERSDLVSVLSVHIIFDILAPYLSLDSRVVLGQTCRVLRNRVWEEQSRCFRFVDLSDTRPAFLQLPALPGDTANTPIIRHLHLSESFEETRQKWYITALYQGIKRLNILPRIHTLILDEQYILFPLLNHLLQEESLNIKILSIRSPRNDPNYSRLQMMVQNLANNNCHRRSPPMLETLYCLGPSDRIAARIQGNRPQEIESAAGTSGVTNSLFARIGVDNSFDTQTGLYTESFNAERSSIWYENVGRVFPANSIHPGWASCMLQCEGAITFDAVLCRGPAHGRSVAEYEPGPQGFIEPRVADISFGSHGCQICGTCPEGPAVFGESPSDYFPALSPILRHSSSSKDAQTPPMSGNNAPTTILRCSDCMRGRWCEQCNKWWCEICYRLPETGKRTLKQKNEAKRESRAGITHRNIKVHQGLCVEKCLVEQWMNCAGSGGMWG